jgi:hypothetical protein
MVKECSSERYFERLYVLPPAVWIGKGFLVEEPIDRRECQVTGMGSTNLCRFLLRQSEILRRRYHDDAGISRLRPFGAALKFR